MCVLVSRLIDIRSIILLHRPAEGHNKPQHCTAHHSISPRMSSLTGKSSDSNGRCGVHLHVSENLNRCIIDSHIHTNNCSLMASHQTRVATLCEAELMHPSVPFEHFVMHRLRLFGRAAPLRCKGMA